MKNNFLRKISYCFILLTIFFAKPAFPDTRINLKDYEDSVNEIKNILIKKHKVDADYINTALGEIKIRKKP